ncbi:hypothetical protein FRC12_013252 [Ceratobasidium sp. 428]|nr:hypothetical protein FRC12_013252 [Ceratobasidium sp. 428]
MANLNPYNLPGTTESVSASSPITIPAAPGTDLWRKPPSTNSTNAPYYAEYHSLSSFRRALVTVNAKWDRLYDQGGLILLLPGSENAGSLRSHSSSLTTSDKNDKAYEAWVKTGIEMFDGKPNVGTVATPAHGYSDWSLVPTPPGTTSVTIEVVRQQDGPGLYIYIVDGDKKTMIREVTWVFHGSDPQGMLGVGVYAARPTKVEGETEKGEALSVHFEGLEIEWDTK